MDVIIKKEYEQCHGCVRYATRFYCPKCEINFPWDRQGKQFKYCHNCGQHLIWDKIYKYE